MSREFPVYGSASSTLYASWILSRAFSAAQVLGHPALAADLNDNIVVAFIIYYRIDGSRNTTFILFWSTQTRNSRCSKVQGIGCPDGVGAVAGIGLEIVGGVRSKG